MTELAFNSTFTLLQRSGLKIILSSHFLYLHYVPAIVQNALYILSQILQQIDKVAFICSMVQKSKA